MMVKSNTGRKEINTASKRFGEGKVKLFILEQMLRESDKQDWQTREFLSALNASFEPKRTWKRDSVINHLRQLRKLRFVEFDKVKNQYSLPKNFDSFDYPRDLSKAFDSVIVAGLLKYFSKGVQEKYLIYHFDKTSKDVSAYLSKKPQWKQLEILTRRESDFAMFGMEGLIKNNMLLAFLSQAKVGKEKLIEKDVAYRTIFEKIQGFNESALDDLLRHLQNMEKLLREKNMPKTSKFILIYVYNHVLRGLKQENLIDY